VVKLHRANAIFRGHALVCLVSRYDQFLTNILKFAFMQNPGRATGNDRSLTYEELLALDSLDDITGAFVAKEIDSLLHQSHEEQLSYLDKEFKLGLRAELSTYSTFVELTQRRNLLVHNGGIVNRLYIKKCKEIGYCIDKGVDVGKCLAVSDNYFDKSFYCLFELGIRVGYGLVCRVYRDNLEEIHDSLRDKVGFRLLCKGQWFLAKMVFDFVISWPEKFIPNDEVRRICVVNSAIASKESGKSQEAYRLLDSFDWSSQSDMFLLPVAILRENWKEAERLMVGTSPGNPFAEEHYREWPIFIHFRERIEFRRAFKKVFDKRFIKRRPRLPENQDITVESEHRQKNE
jgi:hypothetical protein